MIEKPTSIVIFGGTGDLARRKLVPALFQLWRKGRLPDTLHISCKTEKAGRESVVLTDRETCFNILTTSQHTGRTRHSNRSLRWFR